MSVYKFLLTSQSLPNFVCVCESVCVCVCVCVSVCVCSVMFDSVILWTVDLQAPLLAK